MIFFFNVETIFTAAKAPLLADATLSTSAYLGAAFKSFTQRAPEDATAPFLVLSLNMWTPDENQYYRGELRVTNYVRLLPSKQIDPKGNLILSRCEELLNNVTLSISGATLQPLFSLGTIPHFWDPQDLSKSRGLVRFRIEGGKNG